MTLKVRAIELEILCYCNAALYIWCEINTVSFPISCFGPHSKRFLVRHSTPLSLQSYPPPSIYLRYNTTRRRDYTTAVFYLKCDPAESIIPPDSSRSNFFDLLSSSELNTINIPCFLYNDFLYLNQEFFWSSTFSSVKNNFLFVCLGWYWGLWQRNIEMLITRISFVVDRKIWYSRYYGFRSLFWPRQ